jgi:alkylhydroperoxidase family enzyme
MLRTLSLCCVCLCGATVALAEDQQPVETPRPIPLTRPAMKELLEDLKSRPHRVPLPEPTAEELAAGDQFRYESRVRELYMPAGTPSVVSGNMQRNRTPQTGTPGQPQPRRDWSRNADEAMTLTYAFKTRLFWIVSRTNNCHYCLGHQEQKLSAVGMTDDQIAALDFDWLQYPEDERAAFAYARKITWEPHRLSDADFSALREHYTDLQILEMTLSTAWNNAINRWKEGLGVPQEQRGEMFFSNKSADIPADRPLPLESFLTPTSDEYQSSVSLIATVGDDARTGAQAAGGINTRAPLESRADVQAKLSSISHREPRLPLVDEAKTRELLGDAAPEGTIPNWMRLLANFPNDGLGRAAACNEIESEAGVLSPLTKAQVAWIVARQDRAWYATGLAFQRLRALGQSEDDIYALDGDWSQFPSDQRAVFTFARALANTPIALTDSQFAEVLSQSGPETCVQLINYTVGRVYFDRVTEAAGLPLESPIEFETQP